MNSDSFIIGFLKSRFGARIRKGSKTEIEQLFKKEEFKRKELIFLNGERNTRHYFIEKGLVRLYFIDKNGREFNVEFAKEGQILCDFASPEPTSFNLEAIETTTAYSISDEAIKNLMKELDMKEELNPSFIIKKSYIEIQSRLVNILAHSAEQNYEKFIEKYPGLLQRLPQYHIAAYLGVSAEFLSKIRSKKAKK